mmetsp:Transcript_11335/g.21991  ORF Transcript_11335/g.21991 Transcript_11335/m.21991 type:complete len:359 (+) Transcript_11335:212-1288(+)
MVNQQGCEQQRQMPDGEPEGPPREHLRVRQPEAEGIAAEGQAQRDGAGQIEPAAHAGQEGQQRGREQHPGVEQDLQPRVVVAMGDRQHRQAGAGVVFGAVEGQGPEVRRRPQEDDQAQQPGLGPEVAAQRGPAQHRRHRARGAADDDVLRCHRLQDDGVDHRIADEGGEGQPHRQHVDIDPEDGHADTAQQRRERQGLRAAELALGGGAPGGALHAGIDAVFDQAVEGGGGAGDQPDAGDGSQHRQRLGQRGQAGHGQGHADGGAEHDELDDARLGQLVVLLPARAVHQGTGGGRGSHGQGCARPVRASKMVSRPSSAAAPAVWARAATMGQSSTTLDRPEASCQPAAASSQRDQGAA